MGILEIHVPFMVMFYSFLIHSTVNPGSFYTFMTKQFLYLFNRHTSVE